MGKGITNLARAADREPRPGVCQISKHISFETWTSERIDRLDRASRKQPCRWLALKFDVYGTRLRERERERERWDGM